LRFQLVNSSLNRGELRALLTVKPDQAPRSRERRALAI
jgi:hypothetical protein